MKFLTKMSGLLLALLPIVLSAGAYRFVFLRGWPPMPDRVPSLPWLVAPPGRDPGGTWTS